VVTMAHQVIQKTSVGSYLHTLGRKQRSFMCPMCNKVMLVKLVAPFKKLTFHTTFEALHAHASSTVEWIVDFGCAHYMVKDGSLFFALDPNHNVIQKIYIGDDIAFPMCVTQTATVENGVVNYVYHVLDSNTNLLFVYQMT
jgi:hypothetical protein